MLDLILPLAAYYGPLSDEVLHALLNRGSEGSEFVKAADHFLDIMTVMLSFLDDVPLDLERAVEDKLTSILRPIPQDIPENLKEKFELYIIEILKFLPKEISTDLEKELAKQRLKLEKREAHSIKTNSALIP